MKGDCCARAVVDGLLSVERENAQAEADPMVIFFFSTWALFAATASAQDMTCNEFTVPAANDFWVRDCVGGLSDLVDYHVHVHDCCMDGGCGVILHSE